jgi:LCP family protein required for cell wall assembly
MLGGSARVVAVGVGLALLAGCASSAKTERGIIVGKSTTTATAAPGPTIPLEPSTTTTEAEPSSTTGHSVAIASGPPVTVPPEGFPDGSPYGSAIPFTTAVDVPNDLVWVLAIGGDARPGGDPRRSNGDSLHLLGVNPATGAGTILGFPRDSWVEIPGHGTGKLNSALALGGPKLMAETIRHLTGLPVQYYVLTAFEGFQQIVDELGGLNVKVDRKMNDSFSGARFDPGWHNFNGGEALAYSRDRHDVENGDFTRSAHQGNVILSSLAKLRAEVSDDAGLQRWIGVLLRHADLDSPPTQLLQLAVVARKLNPDRLRNIVLPGRVGTAGGQSVVFLGDEAKRIFLDMRDDAIVGPPPPPVVAQSVDTTTTSTTTPTTESTSSTTTTSVTTATTTSLLRLRQ